MKFQIINQFWLTSIKRLLISSLITVILGYIIGVKPSTCIVLICLAVIIWNYYQLHLFSFWLKYKKLSLIPTGFGFWGYAWDQLHKFQSKNHKKTKLLQQRINRLKNSFSSISDAIVILNSDSSIDWSNKSSEHLLGLKYPRDQYQLLIHLIRNPRFINYFSATDQHSQQSPLEIYAPNNPNITLQIEITNFDQNKLLIARDITQIKQLEQNRKDFFANISHEIRTPLTVIQGYIETLSQLPSPTLDQRWDKGFKHLHEQTQRIQLLLEDLLKLSHLESTSANLDVIKIDVATLINHICQIFTPCLEQRELKQNCEPTLYLLGQQNEIDSMITNLISNAIRYTSKNGIIKIKWYRDENYGYLKIIDDGIGIEPQHIDRLTERFYRVDKSRSLATGGTGLGLSIVKHILRRHQATLEITSTPRNGSCFSCRFPKELLSTTI